MANNFSIFCPVSSKLFNFPIILSCGHTFDRESLEKLNKSICPLCNKFYYNYSPNWFLIKRLNLNVNYDELFNIESYNATDARNEMLKIEYNEKLLIRMINKIKKRANLGYDFYIHLYNTFIVSKREINSIQEILKKKGFFTKDGYPTFWYGQLYISRK